MARRRQEERRAGIASRGLVRRLGCCSSRVRHRGVPDRDWVPARCHAAGAAVDVCRDVPTGAPRAARGGWRCGRRFASPLCVATCPTNSCAARGAICPL